MAGFADVLTANKKKKGMKRGKGEAAEEAAEKKGKGGKIPFLAFLKKKKR